MVQSVLMRLGEERYCTLSFEDGAHLDCIYIRHTLLHYYKRIIIELFYYIAIPKLLIFFY